MEAIEFLKAAKRMYESRTGVRTDAIYFDDFDFESYVKEVEEWCKSNNPTKTRQTEFLKMYPNVHIRSNGCVDVAPCILDAEVYRECSQSPIVCDECYKKFWGKEVE